MKNLIAVRANNGLFNTLMIFIGISFMLVWLPLLRCLFDGVTYSWGQWYFGFSLFSAGVSADYFVLIPFLLLHLALFYSFYYAKNRNVFYGLLILWWTHFWGNFLLEILVKGDMVFNGDTLGVHVSLSSIIIPLATLALLLVIAVIRKDRSMEEVSLPRTSNNRLLTWIILAPLPIQAILFMVGEPHELTDEIGVIITILQSFAIPMIFFPGKAQARVTEMYAG